MALLSVIVLSAKETNRVFSNPTKVLIRAMETMVEDSLK